MATVAPSRVPLTINNVNKKPFGWISKFYKKSHPTNVGELTDDTENADISSLRPTISTRVPSTSSIAHVELSPTESFETAQEVIEPSAPSVQSKESSIPSIFTTKTAETQPTIAVPPSVMSSRASGYIGASDNASMLTLASSSKGPRRRRSIDTNCSMRAIAPASARGSFESARTDDVRRMIT